MTVQLGGMDDRAVPAKDSARLITNMQWSPEGFWEPVWGAIPITAFTEGSGPIGAVHWFEPRPNQRWLVTERRIDASTSRIAYVDFPGGGVPVTIADRRRLDSDDLGTTFMDQGRWLWMLSPVDGLFRWNGERTSPVGFQGPAAAPIVLGPLQLNIAVDRAGLAYPAAGISDTTQRGVGSFPTSPVERWVYAYGVTTLNDLGQESPMSPIVIVTGQNTTAQGRSPVRIEVGMSPTNVRVVRLWRSVNLVGVENPAEGPAMRLLQEFATAYEFMWLDIADDAELGEIFDRNEVGAVPIGARAMASFAGLTWLGGCPDNPSRLFHSSPGFPEQFGPLNYVPVGSASTGGIVALHPVGRALLVFKTGGIFVVKGNALDGFRVDEIDGTKGTASPRAIVTVPGIGVLFLEPNAGPHAVVGTLDDDQPTTVRPIAAGIRKLWARRAGVLLGQAIVSYDPTREEVWWHVPEGGNARPSLGVVLHTATGAWSTRPDWEIGAFANYRGVVWLGSTDDTDAPGVYALTGGRRSKPDETAIDGTYTTNPIRLDSERMWHFKHVRGVGIATGAEWSISTKSDRQRSATEQAETNPTLRHHSHDRPRWSDARWGANGEFDDYDVSTFPVSVLTGFALEHSLRISSGRMRMTHLELVVIDAGTDPQPVERR